MRFKTTESHTEDHWGKFFPAVNSILSINGAWHYQNLTFDYDKMRFKANILNEGIVL